MSPKVEVTQEGGQVALVVSNCDLVEVNQITKRFTQIQAMVQQIVAADGQVAKLADEEFVRLNQALQAVDLRYQARIEFARMEAAALLNVAIGREDIAAHGFPELSDE